MINVERLIIRKEDLSVLTDEQILQLICQGDEHAADYLIEKYRHFVWAKTRTYFIIGGDREDLIQEGMIGLYNAIRDYDEDKLASFKGFAELCITRQIITAIKTATRQKHIPLNSSVSLDKPLYDEETPRTLLDVISSTTDVDPQELLLSREKYITIQLKLAGLLSKLERNVLYLYIEGCSYEEISIELNRHIKSVDNALQRVKTKLGQLTEVKELKFQ